MSGTKWKATNFVPRRYINGRAFIVYMGGDDVPMNAPSDAWVGYSGDNVDS